MVYAIYEEFFPDVEKKLNRIANKCMKHGNPFTYEIKGEEIREIKKVVEFGGVKVCNAEYYKFILIDVEGTARIDNWECIAVLDIHDVGNIIRKINTEVVIPERFKHTENICEHCNSKRNRKNLFVIHNVETEEWKQVGGDCLKLYTNGLNMEYVTAFIDGITELEEMNGRIGEGCGKRYYSVQNVISYAVEIINKIGYFNSESCCPTKRLVMFMMNNFKTFRENVSDVNDELRHYKINARFDCEDFRKSETESFVNEIINHYTNLNDDSEFIHNIKVLLNLEYVQSKDFGFLCYLPEGYARHIQKEIERAKRMENNHFGEVGKRYKDCNIQNVDTIASWYTEWGVTCVYKITLEDGNILTWKTNKSIFADMMEGEEFDKITFTVKNHGEYKGEKQTEITRCKITYRKKMEVEKHPSEEFDLSVLDALYEEA